MLLQAVLAHMAEPGVQPGGMMPLKQGGEPEDPPAASAEQQEQLA